MEKKEFPKKKFEQKNKAEEVRGSGKPSWISDRVFDIIKLVLGICFLPFVYSSSVSFLNQISLIDVSLQNFFWSGIVAFLLVYLFIWELDVVYQIGHKLLEIFFSFLQPLVKVAPFLLPIYTIVLFIVYLFLAVFIKESWLINYTMFLFGFSIALHLVFSSKAVRLKKGDMLKSNYIFGFSFIYIVNIGILSLFFNIMVKDFSFMNYCNGTYSLAAEIFNTVFKQLFAV